MGEDSPGPDDESHDEQAYPRQSELERLERKYGRADVDDSGDDLDEDIEGGDWDDGEEEGANATVEQAREWGKRDGIKAINLAQEQPADYGIEVMDTKAFARAIGVPAADEPGSPARLVCSQRDYVQQGIYFGPELPLAGLISDEASLAFRSSDAAGQAYWDAFELELRRANVSIVTTTHQEMYDDGPSTSLYVVDRNRFPRLDEKEATNYAEDGAFHFDETSVQFAFKPEMQPLTARLTKRFRRRT
jgi:hypothetical protein